jgi:hypothetical protein
VGAVARRQSLCSRRRSSRAPKRSEEPPEERKRYWLYQEVLRLQDLLRLVAAELERLAATEAGPQRRAVLLRRAMRIRARLHEAWPRG